MSNIKVKAMKVPKKDPRKLALKLRANLLRRKTQLKKITGKVNEKN